jgi:hypothetical protein
LNLRENGLSIGAFVLQTGQSRDEASIREGVYVWGTALKIANAGEYELARPERFELPTYCSGV